MAHEDNGAQLASWVFTHKIRPAGLLPSFRTVRDSLDNAMMEPFWSTMQIKFLNRKRWRAQIEFVNAIFEYIEVFFSRRRSHSSPEYSIPLDADPARTLQALTSTGSQRPTVKTKI